MGVGEIIILGAFVVSVINSIVKATKKAKPTAVPPRPVIQRTEEEYIDDFWKEESEENIYEEPMVVTPPPFVQKESPVSAKKEEKFEIIDEIGYNFSDASEIRKAIIYSEIINKKY